MTDMFRTIEEAECYLESHITSPHTTKERTLRRITRLMELLGNPERNLSVFHVTGSYGKSSTAYMIASLLEQKGLTVGLHIKPHLLSITERISINRMPIPEQMFVRYMNKVKTAAEAMGEQPTYFELLVSLMLLYFSDRHVNVAVIEAGRGGRLDATNVTGADMLVLTNVFLVHTDILGDTKKKILQEKMGLARPRTKIIAGITQKPLQIYIRALAKPLHTSVQFLQRDNLTHLHIPLQGKLQRKNASLAILAASSYTHLTDKHITAAFSSMQFPGRFEVQQVGTNTLILDSAHNEEKMRFLLAYLQERYPNKKMTIILLNKNSEEMRAFQKILKPIAETFLPVSLEEDKHTQGMHPAKAAAYIQSCTDTLFLVTGSMRLIGRIRAGLSLPYRLK